MGGHGGADERARGADDRRLRRARRFAPRWAPPATDADRLGIVVAIAASVALAAAGIVAAFGERLVWQPFHGFRSGGAGSGRQSGRPVPDPHRPRVAPPVHRPPRTQAPRARAALRPLLVLCVVGVVVVDNVFEFLIVYELTVVAIYALISVRYEDPRARRAAALTLTLAKLGGAPCWPGWCCSASRPAAFRSSSWLTPGRISELVDPRRVLRAAVRRFRRQGGADPAADLAARRLRRCRRRQLGPDRRRIAERRVLRDAARLVRVPRPSRRVVGGGRAAGRRAHGADRDPRRHPATRAARVRRLLVDRELPA